MKLLVGIGAIRLLGMVIIIYSIPWIIPEWRTGYAIFHGVIGGVIGLVVLGALGYMLYERDALRSDLSRKGLTGERAAEEMQRVLRVRSKSQGRIGQPLRVGDFQVTVLRAEAYDATPHCESMKWCNRSGPNYRVRIRLEQVSLRSHFRLDQTYTNPTFSLVTKRGDIHASFSCRRCPETLEVALKRATLMPPRSAKIEHWVYFERVGSPAWVEQVSYSPPTRPGEPKPTKHISLL